MAHVILMPQAGQSMTEGRIVSWLKDEGDPVRRGDPLLEIETDKANLEVEALEEGVLRKIFCRAGEICPVLLAVGVIGKADEDIDFDLLRRSAPGEVSRGEQKKPAGKKTASKRTPREEKAPSKTALKPAGEAAPAFPVQTAVRSSRELTPSVPPAIATSPVRNVPMASQTRDGRGRRIPASPLARRLAEERGVNLAWLKGSGPGGRILRRDVESATLPGVAPTNGFGNVELRSLSAPYPPPSPRPPAEVALEGVRGAIAATLQYSKSTIPHYYASLSIDMTNGLALKERCAREGLKLTINDLILRGVTLSLADEPRVNCRVFDDHIEYPEDINIGIAVGSEQGLVVPVLMRTQTLGLEEVARESRRLVHSAQQGKLVGSGQGTFTISNLGMYGVDSFTAIINPPEGAILAVGSIEQRLIPSGGGFFPRSMMRVQLSSDHRAIDGLLAARFLSRLRYFLETAQL